MATLQELKSATVVHPNPMQSQAVDNSYQYPSGPIDPSSRFARRDFLVDAHREWKARVNLVTQIANGEWYRAWPDLTREPTAPSVANVIEMGISHMGAVGGAVVPSIKVPVPFTAKGGDGKRGAEKRERRVRELREKSNFPHLLSLLWQDYAGAGACMLAVWANFEERDPAKRNPYYMRIDPRHYYPVKDSHGNVTELLVARKRHIVDVAREYPGLVDPSDFAAPDKTVEEWFWYNKEEVLHAFADYPSKNPSAKRTIKIIHQAENTLGLVPAVEIVRPTFDGDRRGQFDQVIHILRVMHQLMVLTVERSEEEVYPTVAGYDAKGLENFGAGGTIEYRSADGRVDVFSPRTMFDVKDLIARLEDNARQQARYPQQLTGEPGASIASARAVKASQGALDAALAIAHRQFEWGLSKADSFALMVDEQWCPGEKTIYGDSRDRKNPEGFDPERDIAGNYEVVVSYGLGVGADPANREVRLQMHLANGLISRQLARQELDFLEDDAWEENRIIREQAIDALTAGVLQAAAQGDKADAMNLIELLANRNLTLDEVMIELIKKKQAQEQAAPPGDMGMGGGDPFAAATGAESIARGGTPEPPGLPGLPGILGPSAPRQVI